MNLLLLDMKTIFITLVVGHLFTVILISAYWRDHKKDSTLNVFFCAKCVQAVSWLFLTLRGGIPDIITISLANSFLFLGASLEVAALLMLLGAFHTTAKRFYIWLTAFNVAGFHLILLLHNVENIRIVYASISTAIVVVYPAYLFLLRRNISMLTKIMGALYLFVIISLVGRGLVALFSDEQMGLFTPGLYQTLSFLALFLVMFLGNTGFILLLKERADRELIIMASIDELTNTLNRRTFIDRAKNLLEDFAKTKNPVSMILFDIDHFKEINDTHGHDIGDRVLQHLSGQIKQQLGSANLFGRYGGDEFAIFLPGMDEVRSTQFAEAIQHSIDSFSMGNVQVPYTLSMGILTVIPDHRSQLDSLYIQCDKALYRAKEEGRNRVCRGWLEFTEVS